MFVFSLSPAAAMNKVLTLSNKYVKQDNNSGYYDNEFIISPKPTPINQNTLNSIAFVIDITPDLLTSGSFIPPSVIYCPQGKGFLNVGPMDTPINSGGSGGRLVTNNNTSRTIAANGFNLHKVANNQYNIIFDAGGGREGLHSLTYNQTNDLVRWLEPGTSPAEELWAFNIYPTTL